MTRTTFKMGWTDVDYSDDPDRFIRLLDSILGGEGDDADRYRNLLRLLDPHEGERFLDVGCGTGGAARAMAKRVGNNGMVVGIDSSRTMIEEAQRRTDPAHRSLTFQMADAHNLPFADHSFDACYSLGVFEVVSDPLRALREMSRVTGPGGRVVIYGPDMDLTAIDSSYPGLTREVLHYISDNETNGWVGRQLPRLFKEAGLVDVSTEASTVIVTDFHRIYDLWLKECLGGAQSAGIASPAGIAKWVEDLEERHRTGTFLCSQTLFRVVGRKR